jgi:hypothetical protein
MFTRQVGDLLRYRSGEIGAWLDRVNVHEDLC